MPYSISPHLIIVKGQWQGEGQVVRLPILNMRQPERGLRSKMGSLHIQKRQRVPAYPPHCISCSVGVLKVASTFIWEMSSSIHRCVQASYAAVFPGPGAAVADLPALLFSHHRAGVSLCHAGKSLSGSIHLWGRLWCLKYMVTSVCLLLRNVHVLFNLQKSSTPFFLSFTLLIRQGFGKVAVKAWMLLVWKKISRAHVERETCCSWDDIFEQVVVKEKDQATDNMA